MYFSLLAVMNFHFGNNKSIEIFKIMIKKIVCVCVHMFKKCSNQADNRYLLLLYAGSYAQVTATMMVMAMGDDNNIDKSQKHSVQASYYILLS